ncbi:MAG: hypothetical protein AAF086_05355 [Planctomycetota bacterium]
MKILSPDQTAAAWSFVNNYGRPLERAWLAFHFAQGSADEVSAELLRFQNDDGGFGHALEPDVQLADSSVIATTIGLQALRKTRAPASTPSVRRAIAYLLGQLDRDTLAWDLVPTNVDDAPHAPWWNLPDTPPIGFTANPGAEIVGHFHYWSSLVPADLLVRLTDAAMDRLRGVREAEMHDAFCYEAMRQTDAVPADVRAELLERLRPVFIQNVATDRSQWGGYVTRPLQVACAPDSPYRPGFATAVADQLDYLVETQQANGAWPLHWSWGDNGGEAWERAKRDWQGVVIVNHLQVLHSFGRLERSV